MNKEQKEIFENANNIAYQSLITAMIACEIPNFITSTFEAGGYRYKLTFKKEKI